MNKQELRKKYAVIRKSIQDRRQKDEIIANKLRSIALGHESVFVYVSMGSEVDTHDFIKLNPDKVYIPFTQNGTMSCRKYLGGELNADKLGNIDMGSYGAEGAPTLSVVPMLAFDRGCFRLGYGGGYYDRYLSSAFTVKVGIAYDEQLTEENFAEIFDVPLDMIITPTAIYRR